MKFLYIKFKFTTQLIWGPGIKYLENEYADIHLPYEDSVRLVSLLYDRNLNYKQNITE